jgi:hypothetical protein
MSGSVGMEAWFDNLVNWEYVEALLAKA